MRRSPWIPTSASSAARRVARRRSAARMSSSGNSVVPTITSVDPRPLHPRAETLDRSDWSASPRTSASTTSASSRASHAPRTSAARAYTSAAENATSREYRRTASRTSRSPPGAASSSECVSTTFTITRTSWSVCCNEIERVSSGGAAEKMSPTPCGGAAGSENHPMNAAIPAWATSPTHERSSAGSVRYQARSSSRRRIAEAASRPLASRTRRSVSASVLVDCSRMP
ncbi:hypothetical protein GALL_380220 [mine drainage metagenome]|uniref:Uncharacterized protein n=1 Tax=mine drainage metagenome TaxID=410659 RepID=A0A1J5Q9C7_9ZZZZ